ncbi:PepSY-associated TM helix domain-containing protein [uncultured Bacteroides sp.]|uniref:PepSY-associated TM helix domain-containing protein n=1 Tax=uncultured Bacteroides sp. TaxID=162156 RepID=UPI0025DBE8DB|nr:PepSY-associated TM helix domain-containing protein [uncultured Bacteroides sp.]
MRKIFRNIHLWLSIPFGVLITLICFSGAALVFEKEVMELCHRDLYFVKKVEAVPLPMEQLMTRVAAILPDSISVTGVNVSSEPERAYQVTLSKPRRASMYIDQYTGEVTGKYERAPFFNVMFRMHRWMLDSMKPDGGIFWGKIIVGTSTLMFVFVLISGIVIWWPRTRKALKNSLKIVANKGWRRFWYDLHVAGGMYTLVFLLAMSLTGLTWSFQWYRTGFYKVFGVEVVPGMGHGNAATNSTARSGKPEGKLRHSPYANWERVYEQLAQANPDYRQISISNGSASVATDRFGNQRATDRYKFNPRNGEITETILYSDLENSGKIRGWIYSVHVGSWGGMLTRILTFIAALIGASLPLTGYYLWIRKKVKRRRATGVSTSRLGTERVAS